MQLELAGKRALVTGSTSGIGTSIAEILAAEGAQVVINGRNAERAAQVAERIRDAGGTAAIAMGDVSSDEGAAKVAHAAVEALGGIDILVNNAGGTAGTGGQIDWLAASLEDWEKTHNANTLAAVRLCRLLAPAMQERGWGRIIHIASAAGVEPGSILDYGATKAAMINFSLGLSKKLAGTGVTSNVVCPGMIKTTALQEWFENISEQNGWGRDVERGEQFALDNYVHQSVARVGLPEDIGNFVTYLASPLSDFISGALFRLDGGASHGY